MLVISHTRKISVLFNSERDIPEGIELGPAESLFNDLERGPKEFLGSLTPPEGYFAAYGSFFLIENAGRVLLAKHLTTP